jgi:cytidine deaminase
MRWLVPVAIGIVLASVLVFSIVEMRNQSLKWHAERERLFAACMKDGHAEYECLALVREAMRR